MPTYCVAPTDATGVRENKVQSPGRLIFKGVGRANAKLAAQLSRLASNWSDNNTANETRGLIRRIQVFAASNGQHLNLQPLPSLAFVAINIRVPQTPPICIILLMHDGRVGINSDSPRKRLFLCLLQQLPSPHCDQFIAQVHSIPKKRKPLNEVDAGALQVVSMGGATYSSKTGYGDS